MLPRVAALRRTSSVLAFTTLATMAVVTWSAPASAHPHIWIKNRAMLEMAGGRVVAITQEWTFDAFFSAALTKDFDVDKNGKLTPPEIAAMRKNAFSALKDFNYFTRVRVDGKTVRPTDVRAFSARIAKGRVVYRFTLGLPAPIDPRRRKAAFLFYDQTYYVDVALAGAKPVALRNGGGCRVVLADDTAHPIYFGLVVPKMATVVCADG